jgi:hypothetical protein
VPCEPGKYNTDDFIPTGENRIPMQGEFFWSEKAGHVMRAAWGFTESRKIMVHKNQPDGERSQDQEVGMKNFNVTKEQRKRIKELVRAGKSNEEIRAEFHGVELTDKFFSNTRYNMNSSIARNNTSKASIRKTRQPKTKEAVLPVGGGYGAALDALKCERDMHNAAIEQLDKVIESIQKLMHGK